MTKDQMAGVPPARQGQKRRGLRLATASRARSESERTLEFDRRVGGGVRQPELNADIQGNLHFRRLGDPVFIVVAVSAALVVVLAGIVEQGRANAVVLVVERPGLGQTLELGDHAGPDPLM